MSPGPKSMYRVYAGYTLSEAAVFKWILASKTGDPLPRWRHYLMESQAEEVQKAFSEDLADRTLPQMLIFRPTVKKFGGILTRAGEIAPIFIRYNDGGWKFGIAGIYQLKESQEDEAPAWDEDNPKNGRLVAWLKNVVECLEIEPFLDNPRIQLVQEGADSIKSIIT
ncbi:hypothetical protein D9611_004220 [Ephemerocybe angulata]|uniref:Uncharacterized protein n=1 Tax=Ephemerocybe angulata TaxID=980116 RepID=A0A8H5BK40_9AGAR|nr:hypothetical protein D9611_004220 [Tulosesus angulatus]